VPTNAKRVPKIKKRPHGSGAAQAQRNVLNEHKILQRALTNTLNERIIKTVKDTTHNQLEVTKMKLSKNMIEKIWNARDVICGMDGWVTGKQYAYKATKWDESSKKMLVAKYQYGELVDTAWVNV
jgi:hypothetical protein